MCKLSLYMQTHTGKSILISSVSPKAMLFFSRINLDSKNKMCFVEMNNKIVTHGFKKKPDASHMCARTESYNLKQTNKCF
jgi:hypothetical protein